MIAAAFAAGALAGAGAASWLAARRRRELLGRYGRLLSFAMHELNTPATAVHMAVSNLLEGVFGELDPALRPWLETARDQTTRLGALLGELRDLIHLEFQGDFHVPEGEADAAGILEDARARAVRVVEQGGGQLRVAAEPGLPRLRAEPERAARAVAGLLYHARKFRTEGPVVLSARRAETGAAVSVAYRGKPLGEEEARESLELFYPAKLSSGQVLTSCGLGLGAARLLAERMGWRLSLDAAADGGTVLTLLFPASEA